MSAVLPRHAATDSNAKSIIDHWTSERIANALPKDLAIDIGDNRRSAHSPPPHSAPPRHHRRSTDVANSEWDSEWSGTIQNAVGRIYFEMNGGQSYVCSGTVVQDEQADRSIILTAAHCVYDDAQKAFAQNVLFIPNQAGTTGSGTDSNCDNDPLGCWAASFGVADTDWASRSFPANIPFDYAMYVVPASGAHAGPTQKPDGTTISDNLEEAAGSLAVTFDSPPMAFTYALGYSYAHDPNFMHCAEQLGTQTASNYNALWLGGCGLTGGASGGPWIQGDANNHKVVSVNSWGFTSAPGMGAPRLDGSNGGHASDVFALAKCATFQAASSDQGVLWCTAMGTNPCGASSGDCATLTPAPTPAVTPAPAPTPAPTLEGCTDKTLEDGSPWHDSDGESYNCQWYSSQLTRCAQYGGAFENGGFTANQACCTCGGGDAEATESPTPTAPATEPPTVEPTSPSSPTAEPTAEPTATPTDAYSCTDVDNWHDSEGSQYTCEWYAERDHCEHYGSSYANDGSTAQQACCACQTQAPTNAPTEPPTEAPTTCADLTLENGAVWHDSEGSDFGCEWYNHREHCEHYGTEWVNGGMSASQACCTCSGGGTVTSGMVQPID